MLCPLREQGKAASRADRLPDADGRAHGKAHDHHREHMHHLRADGHGGRAGDAVERPDDEQASHAVERLQKVLEQVGQREQDNIFEYAAGGEISFHCTGSLFSELHIV